MKKNVMIEQTFCDVCGAEAGMNTCLKCGKEFCYKCKKTHAMEYGHSVNFTGSGDGLYCNECDEKCRLEGDRVHSAYMLIKALRNESIGWHSDFQKRADAAEAQLNCLIS